MLNQTPLAGDWQKHLTQMTGLANTPVPLTQRRVEEMLALMEQNSRAGAELMKKAVDAAQTPGLSESQTKWMEFWTSSIGAFRSRAEACTQISTKAIDSWIELVRKHGEVTDMRAPCTP